MSDNIPPFEIQGEILKRVPEVKSLLQFRAVSKSWKSLIDNPRFISDYKPHPPRNHVFVWYKNHHIRNKYESFIDNDDDDDHSFAQHKVPFSIPKSVDSLICRLYGSSKGLFYFYSSIYRIAVLWNPTIRKSVTIDVPKVSYEYTLSFGVSPYSNDPKLVRIQRFSNASDNLKPRIVEIYSLSTGEWRTLSSEVLPRSSVTFSNNCHVANIGNYIFWHAEDIKYENGMRMKREMITLFDMITEKFMETYLPDNVVPKDQHNELSLFEIRESLAVVVSYFDYSVKKQFVHVWVMEGGVSDSFTKMYSIIRPDAAHFSLLAFRNNGHPIIQVFNDDEFEVSEHLVAYVPDSEQFTPIRPGSIHTEYVVSYMETLLLLDQ